VSELFSRAAGRGFTMVVASRAGNVVTLRDEPSGLAGEVFSEFQVRVVTVGEITKHPNADKLSITKVDGYPVVIRTGDFKEGDLAVYVPVDSIVPTVIPEFAFLAREGKPTHRVRAARLRGVFSMGMLVSAARFAVMHAEGAEYVAEFYGITKYVPPSELALETKEARKKMGPGAAAVQRIMPVYSLNSFRKAGEIFELGEQVIVTEKIHGTNARFLFKNGRLYVGSHRVLRGASRHRLVERLKRTWLGIKDYFGFPHRAHVYQVAGDVWWEAVEKYGLQEKLAAYPNKVVYGEIYGESVQDLTYDSPVGRKLAVFDVLDLETGRYLDFYDLQDFCAGNKLPMVPTLGECPWHPDLLQSAEGKSLMNFDHVREGIVVRNYDRSKILKHVGQGYLLRKDGGES
jgi:RNA ligase (TIGR02306 family)